MNPEWLSAHLDGELDPAEVVQLEAALARDLELATELEELSRVRSVLRGVAVEPRDGALERIVAAVDEDTVVSFVSSRAPGRRRVPTFAAVAAALVIIASVVGGVGGSTRVPALGDLVERHEAAAAGAEAFMADSEEMPMEMAHSMAPAVPSDYSMQHAFVDGQTVQLVFSTGEGIAVSVFRQEGETDIEELPNWKVSQVGSGEMWSATHGAAHVVVVDGGGYVWIVISEVPSETMMVAMADDLPTRSPTIADRARDMADAAVQPFRFWD